MKASTERFASADPANYWRAGVAASFDVATQTVAPEPRSFCVTLSAPEWKVIRRALTARHDARLVDHVSIAEHDVVTGVRAVILNEAIAAGIHHGDL